MRGLYLVLLTVLLCYDHALSLRCYFYASYRTTDHYQIRHCGGGSNVCYKGDLVMNLTNGEQTKLHHGACARSCKEASETMQLAANLVQNPLISTIEVQGLSCCERDLCNGVTRAGRSLWAIAGGFLLSLGPTLLWALL
ncbi:lymphocyte antigen 6H-like isoform X3 [Saccopteryx bilineata]|uniref:lymphocyte antigen 6H-like isoform X3 n=1 Tax=Saccopteryx bilineata TaxID=59482 RepID=UPI00338FD4AA